MIKKSLLTAALLACAGMGVHAQSSIFNNPANKSYFGVRAALDIAAPGDVKSHGIGIGVYKPGAGFSVGAVYNIPLVANLYIEPGLNLYYNTYLLKKDLFEGIDSGSMRKFGVRIPVMFGYHFDFTDDISVALFTGPELEIGCTADLHACEKVNGHKFKASESVYGEDGGYNRVDCTWKFGASLTYAQHYYIGVGGGIGMCNMYKTDDVSLHENIAQITLGYNF